MAKKDALKQGAKNIKNDKQIEEYMKTSTGNAPKGYEKKDQKFQVAIQKSVKEKAQQRLNNEGIKSLNDLINTLLKMYGNNEIDL